MGEEKGHSSKGFWGNVIHYDSKGHKIGESRPSFFGGYTNYDAKGNKVGESRPNFFGGYSSYDAHGNKTGSSSPNFFGGETHYDANGRRIGSSSAMFLGSQSHSGEFGGPSGLINSAGSSMGVEREAEWFRNAAAAGSGTEEDTGSRRPVAGFGTQDSRSRSPHPDAAQPMKKDSSDTGADTSTEDSGRTVKYYIASSKKCGILHFSSKGRNYAAGDWVFDSTNGDLAQIISVEVCQPENLPKTILDHRLIKASPPIGHPYKQAAVSPSDSKETGSRKNSFRIFMAVLLLTAVVVIGTGIMDHHLNKKHWEDFNGVLAQFDAEFPGIVKTRFRTFSPGRDVEVKSHSTVEKLSYHNWYDWTEEITVTIHAPDSFDMKSEREIYDLLHEAYEVYREAWRDYTRQLPDHNKYSSSFMDKYKGIQAALHVDEQVQIKTSGNTYGYSRHLQDYYTVNGKDHFIRDSASNWTASGSSNLQSKPSGSYGYIPPSSSSDPYHASDYATPEDFYDDNYDEFFSYEDAEDYYQEHEYD